VQRALDTGLLDAHFGEVEEEDEEEAVPVKVACLCSQLGCRQRCKCPAGCLARLVCGTPRNLILILAG
jgi:hypothetical protein